MPYSLRKIIHPQYGNLIEVVRQEGGQYLSPFDLERAAKRQRRLWVEATKIRYLLDNQVLTGSQLGSWAKEEYRELPKCGLCQVILGEDLHQHSLTNDFFCSRTCADQHYDQTEDHLNDYEEVDI